MTQRIYFTMPHNASLTSYVEADPDTGAGRLVVEQSPNDCLMSAFAQRKAEMEQHLRMMLADRTGTTPDTVLDDFSKLASIADPLKRIKDPWKSARRAAQSPKAGQGRQG